MTRRDWILLSLGTAAPALAQAGRIKLGLDCYSIRSLRWKAERLIQYSVEQRLDQIQLSIPGDLESLEPAYLSRVRDAARNDGLVLEGAIGSVVQSSQAWSKNNVSPAAYLEKGLRTTAALGGKVLRCYLANPGYRVNANAPASADFVRQAEELVANLRGVRTLAMDLGITIAVENHGDIQARELLDVIQTAGTDFTGVCLDSGNPMWVLEDPLMSLEILGPHVVSTHLRDSVVFRHPRGIAFQWTAVGEGVIDWPKYIETFRRLCPNVAFQLEVITGRPPNVLPLFEPGFWKSLDRMRAADLSRFLKLSESGQPFYGKMLIGGENEGPASYRAAIVEQQRVDLERSFEFCRRLGAGRI
jgi:sugar phosphate isomerase/epimerase